MPADGSAKPNPFDVTGFTPVTASELLRIKPSRK